METEDTSTLFTALTLSALVINASKVSLTASEPDTGATSSTETECLADLSRHQPGDMLCGA